MIQEGNFAGEYRTPPIGAESAIQLAEHRLSISEDHVVTIQSPLWEAPYAVGDGQTFRDPRADKFLQIFTFHQFHHFTTRQLSFVEEFETRAGASRIVRLGHMLDSAKLLNDLGATFEQIVQTAISDIAHPAGSHQRGDFMVGDYINQDTHDGDLWSYIVRSGFLAALEEAGLVDEEGYLAGSQMKLQQLANPSKPRFYDITECPRPDNNGDRTQFTLHEGVLIHDPHEVRNVLDSILRIETKDGERMAMNNAEAARLMYILGVRHESEHWDEPVRRVFEEVMLLADRYLFAAPNPAAPFKKLQDFYPVDHTRTDEQTWYEGVEELGKLDPFITNVLRIAKSIAAHQRNTSFRYIWEDDAYTGPVKPPGVELVEGSNRRRTSLSIGESGHPDTKELWIALPMKRYRGGIDTPVVTKSGIKRITEIDPTLRAYSDKRKRWVVPLLAKITLPRAVAEEIAFGISVINDHWSGSGQAKFASPAKRMPMPADQLEEQINAARLATFKAARI